MEIREIMRRDVGTVEPLDTVQKAAEVMVESAATTVPVCERGRLVGLMADRDIVSRVAAAGRDPTTTKVGEVMTPDPVHCLEHESDSHIAEEMAQLQVSQLPVVDGSGRLVGMAVLDDVQRTATTETA
jgi:CBS domain-containing protein